MTAAAGEPAPLLPPPAPHRPSILADRLLSVLAVVTIVLLAAMTASIIYLVLRVSSVADANHHLVTQVAAQEKQVSAAQAAARTATITSCQQSNVSRTEDISIWVAVLKLPPGASAATRATVAADLALVRKSYALRNCPAAAG